MKNKTISSFLLFAFLISIISVFSVSAADDAAVWKTSLAYGKSVELIEGTTHAKGPLEGLVDGNVGGENGTIFRANSNAIGENRWTCVQIDLGSEQEVNLFKAYTQKLYTTSPNSYIDAIKIEGSDNDKSFTTIIDETSPASGGSYPYNTILDFKTPKAISVRYIRLWMKTAPQVGEQMMVPALREFGVFNTDAPISASNVSESDQPKSKPIQQTPAITGDINIAKDMLSWTDSLAHAKPVTMMQGSAHAKGPNEGLVDAVASGEDGTIFRANSSALDSERWTWVQVDLEKLQEVNYFKVYTHKLYSKSPNSYITAIRIEGSADGNDFQTIIPDSIPGGGAAYPYDIELAFSATEKVSARYIRLWMKVAPQEGEQVMVPSLKEFGVYYLSDEEKASMIDDGKRPQSELPQAVGGAQVATYSLPACYQESTTFSVEADGKPVPVIQYNDNQKSEYHYAHFSFSGTAMVRITIKNDIKTYRIRPESYDIEGIVEGKNLTFSLSQSRYLMVNINNLQNLVIIADPLEEDVPPSSGSGIYNVKEAPYNADSTGGQNVTKVLQSAIDAASVTGGTVYVPEGVYKISSITMKPNMRLYTEGGAVIRGTGVKSDYVRENDIASPDAVTTLVNFEVGAANIKIYGRGTFDANGEALYEDSSDSKAMQICGLRPNRNSGVSIDGIIVSHGRTWTVVPQMSDNVTIENIKVLNSENRAENDGIDINNCQNVLVQHCFIYTCDDSMCVKACGSGNFKGMIKGPLEDVFNVTFDDIVTYGRCAGAKAGLQGFTRIYNVWFKNIEVLKASRGIAIMHGGGKETMEGIHFVNINVEDLSYRIYSPYPIEMDITSGGKVKNIEVTNVNFKSFGNGTGSDGYNNTNSKIKGFDPSATIENVAFKNLFIAGKPILDAASGYIDINEHVSGVTFATEDIKRDFASFDDITNVPWAKKAIEELAWAGVLSGVGDKEFAPEGLVKREEFAKMLVAAFGLLDNNATTELSDVPIGAWYYPYVASAEQAGIIKGVGVNKFGVGANITRQDMCVMVQRAAEKAGVKFLETTKAANFADEAEIGDYAKDAIVIMQKAGIVSGMGTSTFMPLENATRAQAATIINKVYVSRLYDREIVPKPELDMKPVTVMRINVGKEESYTDKNGNEYLSDRYYSENTTVNSKKSAISETEDDDLYRSYRFGEHLSYTVPVVNGTYNVTLRMIEPALNEVGIRVFNIRIEDKEMLSNLDIYKEVGQYAALDKSFIVEVTDGMLNIDMQATMNNAIVSAIEIVKQ